MEGEGGPPDSQRRPTILLLQEGTKCRIDLKEGQLSPSPLSSQVQTYDPITVCAGGTVTFTWTGTHDVYQASTPPCCPSPPPAATLAAAAAP